MKNLSFGKILALAGGFMLTMIVIALVAVNVMKSQKSGSRVVKKHSAQMEEAVAQPPEQLAPGMHPLLQASSPVAMATSTPVASASAATTTASAAAASATVAAAPAATTADGSEAAIYGTLLNHGTRISRLEQLLAAGARPTATTTTTRAVHQPKRRKQRQYYKPMSAEDRGVVVPAKKPSSEVMLIESTPATELSGYKVMATVGKRAWVSTPSGSTESVTTNDPLPQTARIRSVDRETGEVTTSANQVIRAVE